MIFGAFWKVLSLPLGLSEQKMTAEDYTERFFDKIMDIELELASRPDSVSIGAHLQAIGQKQPTP